METFRESETQMLREFNALLHNSPLPVSDFRLLQLMAINMFSVENAITKGTIVKRPFCSISLIEIIGTKLNLIY